MFLLLPVKFDVKTGITLASANGEINVLLATMSVNRHQNRQLDLKVMAKAIVPLHLRVRARAMASLVLSRHLVLNVAQALVASKISRHATLGLNLEIANMAPSVNSGTRQCASFGSKANVLLLSAISHM